MKLKYWAYRHTNGAILLKRYFAPMDIQEAQESSFVAKIYGPYEADSPHEARVIANEALCK